MYYGATVYVGDGIEVERKLMSLDVRSEKFNQIKLPEGYYRKSCYMVPYVGRLALVKTFKFPSIDIWILTNGDRHEWTHNRVFDSF